MIPASDLWMLGLRGVRATSRAVEHPESSPARPSPSDRYLARRRTIFLRDWILVLIALGLAITAGAFRGDRVNSHEVPAAAYATTAP